MKFLVPLQMAILALFLLGMHVSANELVFFTYHNSEHCSTKAAKDYITCKDMDELACCNSVDPFCARGALLKSDGWTHTTYMSSSYGCNVHEERYNYNYCTTSSGCCINGPVKNTPGCSMWWHFGERSHDPNNPPRKALLETREEPCRDPDVLTYTTADGTQRKIGIPEGNFEQVMEMYTRGDLKALGRYETLQED